MLRKSRLSAAVAFALASAAVVATPVLAEEGQNVEKLQKIKVWLITSCRSANNIMPITFFLPAFIASSFYSA